MNNNVYDGHYLHIPTYYNLFLFPNGGDGTVRVHFSPKSGSKNDWLPEYNFPWSELCRMFDPETGTPYKVMLFDDGFFMVDEYKISMQKKILTIVAGELMAVTDNLTQANQRWEEYMSAAYTL